MSNRQFAVNLSSNFLSMFLNVGIGFVLTPFIIKNLGISAYGFFPLSNNFINYANIITVALNSMGSRFIILKLENNDKVAANEYFNTIFFSNVLLSIVLGGLGFVLTLFIDNILSIPVENSTDVRLLFYFILLNFIISLITSVFSIGTTTANRLDINAYRNIGVTLFRTLLLVVLFIFLPPKLSYLGFTALICSIILGITNWGLMKRFLPDFDLNFVYFKLAYLKELLSSGIWNSVNQLSIVLLTQVDLLLANMFLSAKDMGELSLTKVVPLFIQSIVSVVVGIFVPKFYMLYARNQKTELLNELFFSIKIVSFLVVIPISFFLVYGIDFFRLYVPAEDVEQINRLSILAIIPMVITGSINTLFNIYTVTNQNKIPALVWVVFGVLNVLSVMFLLRYSTLGIYSIPLVALVMGLCRNLIFTPIYGAKCLNVKWHTFYLHIFKGILTGVVMTIVCIISKFLLHIIPSNWITFMLVAFGCGTVALIISLFIHFEIYQLKSLFIQIRNKYVR